jgi:hypothetical protein
MKPQSSQRLRLSVIAVKKFCFDNMVGGWGQEDGSGKLRTKS